MHMTTPNRKQGPPVSQISNITFPKYEKVQIGAKCPLYAVSAGSQEVIKLEIAFYAGRSYETKKLTSRTTASLLKDGTSNLSSNKIANILDFYGSTLNVGAGMDTASISLYCLKKHFESLLPTVIEIICQPTFPQKDLDQFIEKSKHRLKIELQKNDVVAYRLLTELIFDPHHPYGYNSTSNLYGSIDRNDLVDFHQSHYVSNNASLFISGKVDDTVLKQLETSFSHVKEGKKQVPTLVEVPPQLPMKRKHVKNPHGYQSAIRIGKRLFNRNHKDFEGMSFLSTVLGGYFGSRLMKSIREEKGFTYNIDCSIDTMIHDGYFQVGTEVAHENVDQTINEIYHQIEILKTEPIPSAEIKMVKNYLIGNLLNLIDGPFHVSKMLKTLHLTGNDANYLNKTVESILSITPNEVQELANTYFDVSTFHEVVVGA